MTRVLDCLEYMQRDSGRKFDGFEDVYLAEPQPFTVPFEPLHWPRVAPKPRKPTPSKPLGKETERYVLVATIESCSGPVLCTLCGEPTLFGVASGKCQMCVNGWLSFYEKGASPQPMTYPQSV